MTYLRTPGQAAAIYKLGTVAAVRPRGLFFVRFRSPYGDGINYNSGLDFGFAVKSAELPKITAKTEDLNQYNKKRIIHTGYDTSPVTITLVDTVAGTARKLWQGYLANTFGDFNQTTTDVWLSDTMLPDMYGDDTRGFGYITPDKDGSKGEVARNYFESIEIYQLFGNTFTTTVLVNPRIQQFDPDTLDYEDMAPMTFRMQVAYEGVIYRELDDLANNRELYDIFSDVNGFGGSGYEPVDTGLGFLGEVGSQINETVGDILSVGNAIAGVAGLIGGQSAKAGVGGVLQQFSSAVSFGTQISGLGSAAVNGLRTTKSVLKGGVNVKEIGTLVRTATTLGSVAAQTANRISAQTYDNAYAKLSKSKGTSGSVTQVASGAISASSATGKSVSSHLSTSSGLSLSDDALGFTNAQRSPTSKIGVRRKT